MTEQLTAPVVSPARPMITPEVILGPVQRRDDVNVHHLKDRRTNRAYRLGEKEFFVVSLMDGRRTTDDISDAYAARFGRRLGDGSWRQIFGMLGDRQLMAGQSDEAALDRLRRDGETISRRRTLLQRRFVLINPDRFLAMLNRRLSWLFSPLFVLPAVAVAAGLLAFVLVRGGDMVHDFTTVGRWGALPVAFPVTWLVVALHESAHGLVCKHFGGTVREIGVLWRFPILAPFCNTEDTRFFRRRRERVFTAFAGVFTSMLAMVPFAVCWLLAEEGTWWRGTVASIVLFGVAGALLNLTPFLQLDGYHMVNHALGMDNLRQQSYRYWGWLLWHRWRGERRAYRRADHAAYGAYGLATVAFLAALAWLLIGLWYRQLSGWLGPAGAGAFLSAEAVLIIVFVVYARRRAATRAAATAA